MKSNNYSLSGMKVFLFAFLFVVLSIDSHGQYLRKVLVENFDHLDGSYEDEMINWLDSCSEKFSGQVIPLRYHLQECPACCNNDDEFTLHETQSVLDRGYYYPAFHGANQKLFVDGIYSFGTWSIGSNCQAGPCSDSVILQRLTVTSPLNIVVQHSFNSTYDSIHIHVEVTSAINFIGGANNILRIVPFEEKIEFEEAPGNGNFSVVSIPRVVRDMVPDEIGINVGTINAGSTFIYDVDWALNNIYDMREIRVAAFVQDDNTLEVIQAGQSIPQPVPFADCSVKLSKKYYCSQNAINIYPEIQVSNEGLFTIHSLNIDFGLYNGVTYNTTWTGNLAPNTSLILPLTMPLLPDGSYIIEVKVESDLPYDVKPHNNLLHWEPLALSNDEQHLTFYVIPPTGYPVSEDFESGSFPHPGWILESTGTTGAQAYWSESSPGGYMTSLNSMVAELGFMFKHHVHNERTLLTTPSMDFTTAQSPILSFDRSYKQRDYGAAGTYTYDTLNVWASIDCGTSWQLIYQKYKNDLATVPDSATLFFWTPTSNADWKSDSIPLGIFDGQSSVILRFEAVSGEGNSLYLDNINVDEGVYVLGLGKDEMENKFSIYPDPAADYFNVILNPNTNFSNAELKLNDVTGREIYSTNLYAGQEIHISCQHFSPGVYFAVIVNNSSQLAIKKIIIQ